ncbi:ABC transporter permease [Corynebacterium diphtheriae]|nr:ABC transporter permease [Corynebacterium diphtheriae]CAB0492774.1 ABC transporter permease [Corynebacterium diphtheriae]
MPQIFPSAQTEQNLGHFIVSSTALGIWEAHQVDLSQLGWHNFAILIGYASCQIAIHEGNLTLSTSHYYYQLWCCGYIYRANHLADLRHLNGGTHMIFKIALNSVRKGIASWIALLVSSIALSVVLTLNVALIVAGAAVSGDAQQAYISMGGVALAFSVLTGLASFRLVVDTCIRLQQREVALWQIAGLLPPTALAILFTEVVLVTAASAVVGTIITILIWPSYASFVGHSGLPYSSVLEHNIPAPAISIGIAITVIVSILAGISSSRKIVRGDLITGVKASSSFETKRGSVKGYIFTTTLGVAFLVGIIAIYSAIGNRTELTDPQEIGDFVTIYPGMGILLCLVFAFLGPFLIRALVALIQLCPGKVSFFLAAREASARPALTKALVMPISLAASAVGVMTSWVSKLKDILETVSEASSSVSAPPEQMALLLAGPIIAACVSASSIVFATASNREQDNALLIVSGSTRSAAYTKALFETVVYAFISLFCAYFIIIANELAMVAAFSSGPIPSAQVSLPSWAATGVVTFGMSLTLLMLLTVTSTGFRKESITVVLESK